MTDEQPIQEACARCTELEKQLSLMQLENQHLIEQVALERQRADALYVAFPPQSRSEAGEAAAHVSAVLSQEAPLRHKVADAVNDAMKRVLPGMQRLARARADAKGK